jgi:DNA polymerase-1
MTDWLAVDGTNWVHQLYHALDGKDVLQVAASRLQALIAHVKPSVVLVAFDRRSFRHDLAPSYKANRAAKEASLRTLLDGAVDALSKIGQPVYQDGFEADDCLATAADAAVAAGKRCIIMSPDKDLWQCLVAGSVSVLRSFETSRGELARPMWWTAAELAGWHDHNLAPEQWADYQALVGESGDNVQGCPSWGEKTSARALVRVGSIDAMLQYPWSIGATGKQLALLQAWAKSGAKDLAQKLVRLRTDVAAVWDAVL